MLTRRPVQILVVEDNPGDVRLIREALRGGTVPKDLHVAHDGEAALAYLRREGPHAAAARPDLVLLDLNLPKRHGREVLREMKGDPRLATIPVIVLTSSEAETDVRHAYELHANCYLAKPVDFDRFARMMELFEEFWLGLVKLPPAP